MHTLRYRRQFLFTPEPCSELEGWKQTRLYGHILYVHPDCGLAVADNVAADEIRTESASTCLEGEGIESGSAGRVATSGMSRCALIGYIMDPERPDAGDADILQEIARHPTPEAITRCLYPMVGRFVLIVADGDRILFFSDACALRSLFYTRRSGRLYAASQPLLLNRVVPLVRSDRYEQYHALSKRDKSGGHYIPAGSSFYEEVHHLVPNHYYDSHSGRQVRFFPHRPLELLNPPQAVEAYSSLLVKTMKAASQRFRLALPVTAGWDSRVLLAASRQIADRLFLHTLQYRTLTHDSDDIRVPAHMLGDLGLRHHVLDCRKPMDPEFAKIYTSNTDYPHLEHWGAVANGMRGLYPDNYVNIKGNCAEITRCFNYKKTGIHPDITSHEPLAEYVRGWKRLPFAQVQLKQWFEGAAGPVAANRYLLLDLYYWEHRMGSWQAQNQLELDIVQETFTPFNNRKLIDIGLGVDPALRHAPDYPFFRDTIAFMWETLLDYPVNPTKFSWRWKLRRMVKKTLRPRR